jgi:four helix bundle protein
MKARTHAFAVAIVDFAQTLPDQFETRRIRDQLVGAAWGVDGNWHAACCGRTHKEFTSKLGTVVEEADEAEELLNVIHDSRLSRAPELARLRDESTQLRKIFRRASIMASGNERLAEERRKLERANRKRRQKP